MFTCGPLLLVQPNDEVGGVAPVDTYGLDFVYDAKPYVTVNTPLVTETMDYVSDAKPFFVQ